MDSYDFVIVGSGAGGGPLAANLASAGYQVCLLEAGGDDTPPTYAVPAFHARASEDPALAWSYYVAHYADQARAARDSKHVAGKGVLYPRSGTLGGCTAHHAMITVYPHNSDWDGIAALTGERSWRASAMRSYFERMERCTYRHRPLVLPRWPWLARLVSSMPVLSDRFINRSRHGFDGWLETTLADPLLVLRDRQLLGMLAEAAKMSLADVRGRHLDWWEPLDGATDPNDWQHVKTGGTGIWRVPCSIVDGRRNGVRERLQAVASSHPGCLDIRICCLATRVVLDDTGSAVGVEYVAEAGAYRADGQRHDAAPPGESATVLARHEVVLSAGAFNTPQLLMLSGIGPADELARHGIDCRVDLPGVGRNLQDRYEVGVVSEVEEDFVLLEGAAFRPPAAGDPPDPAWAEWQRGGGIYATNGAVIALVHSSRPELPDPDLFLFGLPADFRGYHPGYSSTLTQSQQRFTWAVLKAHTANTAGQVRLRSTDPRDPPDVNFCYFDEGSDEGRDLDDVVRGVELVRDLNRRTGVVRAELYPGPQVDTKERLREFVAAEAWGHHASCTARIGPAGDAMAVVDSQLRVHGVDRLRVVDASVFPKIPGFFIVTPTYMVAEKASDLVLAAARKRLRGRHGTDDHLRRYVP